MSDIGAQYFMKWELINLDYDDICNSDVIDERYVATCE